MGIFRRTSSAARPMVRAAEVGTATSTLVAATSLSWARDRAMRIPTVSRARDLLAGLVATTPLEHLEVGWTASGPTETLLPPEPWMLRPDPDTSRAHTLSWTAEDLMLTGLACWQVTGRYADSRPRAFRWIPSAVVTLDSPMMAGNYPVGGLTALRINGIEVDPSDYVLFYSGQSPMLEMGSRAVLISERLDLSAQRFASNPIASGYIRQTDGDPLTADELDELAERWIELRDERAVAALGIGLDFVESDMDPSRLQSVESRQHQAAELARVCNVSPFLVGAPTGSSMTYQNAQQARAQLLQDALPMLTVIEETLTDAALPRGRAVRFSRAAAERTVGETPA